MIRLSSGTLNQASRAVRRRDVLGRLIRELDRPMPMLAESLRWRRAVRDGTIIARLVDQLVNSGDTAVDVGASHGLFVAGLLQCVGASGAVHAFEPNPVHVDRLRRMGARRKNLTVHGVAVSDRSGTAELMVPVVGGKRFEGMGSLEDPRRKLGGEVDRITVPVARLDDALEDKRVAFIKCDVEGHEDQVCAGAERLLGQRPTVLVEIEQRHRGTDPHLTIDHLASFGLRAWALFGDGLRPASDFDLERDQLSYVATPSGESMPVGYVNDFLFVRPDVDVSAFLARR
jgi:FkbM family methyltransferase